MNRLFRRRHTTMTFGLHQPFRKGDILTLSGEDQWHTNRVIRVLDNHSVLLKRSHCDMIGWGG